MDEKLGVRIKKEAAKIMAMNFREKREYIWEYYKLQIVGGAILLFIVGGLINTWFINPPRKEYLTLGWVSGYETNENLDALSEYLTQRIVPDPEKEYVMVTTFFAMGDPAYDQASAQKLMVMVASQTLDVLVVDKAGIDSMNQTGMIMPWDEVLARAYEMDAGLEAKLADKFVYSEEDGQLLGLRADDCPLFIALKLSPQAQEMYFVRVATTDHNEALAQALTILYE